MPAEYSLGQLLRNRPAKQAELDNFELDDVLSLDDGGLDVLSSRTFTTIDEAAQHAQIREVNIHA